MGSTWVGGQEPSVNGGGALPRLAEQRGQTQRMVLAPELNADARVSWVGRTRLIDAWKSRGAECTWSADVVSELPAPGSAGLLILQAGSPLAEPAILAPWLPNWRRQQGRVLLDYAGENAFPEGAARGQTEQERYRLKLRWLTAAVDAVLVPSSAAADALRSQNPQIIVLPSYLDARLWEVGRHRDAALHASGSGERSPVRIGFIGPFGDRANSIIAPVIARLEQEFGEKVSLEVVGSSGAVPPPFGTQVAVPSGQTFSQYVQWLRSRASWDIGIVPVSEGGELTWDPGQQILQYSALGAAIVASNCSVTRALIQHQHSGLIVENEVEAWYAALRRLLESPELRRRLATQAEQQLGRFTLQANARRYAHTLDTVRALPMRDEVPAVPAELRVIPLPSRPAARTKRGELDALRRKTRKLARDPKAFFADSRSSLLRRVGSLLLVASTPAAASPASRGERATGAPRPVLPRGQVVVELIASLPLPDPLRRKGKKLARDPKAFFADARSPLVRGMGSLLVRPFDSAPGNGARSKGRASSGKNGFANGVRQPHGAAAKRPASRVVRPLREGADIAPAQSDAAVSDQPRVGGARKAQEARKLLLKIEKTVLGNWNALRHAGRAPLPLDVLSRSSLPEVAEALYASTHAEKLTALTKEVTKDVATMKQLLAQLPEQSPDGQRRESEYVAELRAKILQAIPKVSSQLRTPYYSRLAESVTGVADAALLSEVWRTLQDVDLARYGHVPRPVGPLVSVVMPAYNRRDVVADAVSSVLAQTYPHFELLVCDDASADDTTRVLDGFSDSRVRVLRHEERRGAAAARNTCLAQARGAFVAYLDSDNLWHPRFLELMLEELQRSPGSVSAYASFFDVQLNGPQSAKLRKAEIRPFFLEDQLDVPFVDLNSFIHRRELCDVFGVFDERLVRRQDYDIISRYCWIREPHHFARALNIYQRIPSLEQITRVTKGDVSAPNLIRGKLQSYYESGVPAQFPPWLKKVTVISWDMSRNHFAKAYCVAEALSAHLEVELISFRFFEAPIFEPLAGVQPRFEIKAFDGRDFPGFFDEFARAVHAVTGDVIYAVKPRLSSLGVALMANYHTGKPIFLEVNDLETVVASPKAHKHHAELPLEAVLQDLEQAKVPHSLLWSQALDPCVAGIPTVYTHNVNLNIHYGRRCLYMRNIKDDALYDPGSMDRAALRRELGFEPDDRIIVFGGLVRKHKGVFELVELLKSLDDPRYKLLVVASRETPDVLALARQHGKSITVLPPQPPSRMAELNLAADLVVLWLDPAVAAGHYQSPYKISDALAMGPAVIASPTSDLASFSERELVWMVPFGDFPALVRTIDAIFADERERERRRERGRRLFLREFSYKSVPAAVALGASMVKQPDGVYPISTRFAQVFGEFHKRLTEP